MITRFILTIYFYEIICLIAIIDFFLALPIIILPFLKKYLHLVLGISGRLYVFFSGSLFINKTTIKVDHSRPYLILCNHQSMFDIFALYSLLIPLQFKWIIKKSLYFIPFFGALLLIADYIYINRQNRHSALKAIKKAIKTIENGTSVLMFPEGTRSTEDTILPFKSGSLVIATRTEVDLLPIVLKNTLHIFNKKSFLVNPLPLKIKILNPIKVKGLQKKQLDNLLSKTREIMLKEFKAL